MSFWGTLGDIGKLGAGYAGTGARWAGAKALSAYSGAGGIRGMAASLSAGYGNLSAPTRGAVLGAGIGGAYGAFSDDTSMLGGAAMGAGLGLGAVGAKGMARRYSAARGLGMSRLGAASASTQLAGRKINKAFNGFRALGQGFWGR